MERDRFWIVWCPTGHHKPRARHTSGTSAIAEAKRLAGENPGHKFYALEAIGCAHAPDPVQWTELDETEIPF